MKAGPIPDTVLMELLIPYIRRFRRQRAAAVLLNALLAAGAAASAAAISSGTGLLPWPGIRMGFICYITVCCLALLVYSVPVMSRRVILAKIDRYYDLGELLVTAAETDIRHDFGALLRFRAEGALKEGNPKEVFSNRFRKRYVFIPLLALVWVVVSLVGPGGAAPVQEGRILAEDSRRLAARAEEYNLPYSRDFAREMEELAEKLQQETLGRREAVERIEELRRKILRAMDDLERSYLADTGEQRDGGSSEQANGVSGETEGEEATVLGGGTGRPAEEEPGPGKEPSEKSFRESGEEGGTSKGTDTFPRAGEEQYRREMESLEEAEESLSRTRDSLEKDDRTGSTEQDGSPGGGRPQENGEGPGPTAPEEQGGGMPGDTENGSPVAGLEEEEDTPGEMYRRDEDDEEPGIPLEGTEEGSDASLAAFIRALPEYSYPELPEDGTMQEYRRQIEGAVTNEDIPLELRRVVRDYFLILGSGSHETERQ